MRASAACAAARVAASSSRSHASGHAAPGRSAFSSAARRRQASSWRSDHARAGRLGAAFDERFRGGPAQMARPARKQRPPPGRILQLAKCLHCLPCCGDSHGRRMRPARIIRSARSNSSMPSMCTARASGTS